MGQAGRQSYKTLFFHLLVGFDPCASEPPDYWMTDIRRKCSAEVRYSQGKQLNGMSASVGVLFDVLKDANAILIPAHLHSTPDAFKSRSIDNIYADSIFLKHAKGHFHAPGKSRAKRRQLSSTASMKRRDAFTRPASSRAIRMSQTDWDGGRPTFSCRNPHTNN